MYICVTGLVYLSKISANLSVLQVSYLTCSIKTSLRKQQTNENINKSFGINTV